MMIFETTQHTFLFKLKTVSKISSEVFFYVKTKVKKLYLKIGNDKMCVIKL
jgi:hypothetical protein